MRVPLRARLAMLAALLALLSQPLASAIGAPSTYTVQPGDTLETIGGSFGVPVSRLIELNQLADPNQIAAGQPLIVDGSASPPPASPTREYVVKPGDSLSRLAADFGVPLQALVELNHLADPNQLVAGQKLLVPAGGQQGAETRPSAAGSSSGSDVAAMLESAASRHGLETSLLKALAWYLSGWRTEAGTPAGAFGVMQVTTPTEEFVSRSLLQRPLDRGRLSDNVEIGAAYLGYLARKLGDTRQAIAAYLQGPGSLARNGILPPVASALDVIFGSRARFGGAGAQLAPSQQASRPATATAPNALATLAGAIQSLAPGARVGVAARNLMTGQRLELRAGESFPSASVNKALIMAEVFRQAKAGRLTRSASMNGDLEAMITRSDNLAANRLIDVVSAQNVNGLMGSLGLVSTQLRSYFTADRGSIDGGSNRATPADLATFFALIATERLVDQESSRQMRALLARNQDDSKIARGLPPGTAVANKSGWYPGVANDVAIVYGPKATYVLAVLSEGVASDEAGNQLIAGVSRLVYELWNR